MDGQLTYKLELFEGPLDLLLNLISKNKMKIEDIKISIICDQYMEYIASAEKMNIDLSTDFLVMASQLMLIKSRMLLPREEEEEEDPRARLAAALEEYKRIKEASKVLSERYVTYSRRFVKDTDEVKSDTGYVAPHEAELLQSAIAKMFRRLQNADKESKEIEIPFERILRTPIVPVSVKIYSVLRTIKRRGHVSYTGMLATATSKSELIAIFMSVLELIKNSRIRLEPIYDGDEEDFEMYLNDRKSAEPVPVIE
jgi:segregation and condensation protein A